MNHQDYLQRAVELAAEHSHSGENGPFGAVIVQDGQVIAEGWNRVVELHDPTAHAEILAIREASRKLKTHDLTGCILYSSCEPCPMCLAAIYWARITEVYYAASRDAAAAADFDDSRIYDELAQPVERRSVPMTGLSVEGAGEVFRRWRDNPGKKTY